MRIDCIAIFPEIISQALGHSIPGKASERGLLALNTIQLRDFAADKHHKVDDVPYGGGAGMVFKPEPVVAAIKALKTENSLVIHPSPSAPPLTQDVLKRWSGRDHLIFVASRYEGLDQRVIDAYVDEEYSIGDYVISGGELAVSVMVDGLIRLLPGAIGKPESFMDDSFYAGLLEYPHYTRPPEFEGRPVPDVLLSGHHEQIRRWRKTQALARTYQVRPDLIFKRVLDKEETEMMHALKEEWDREEDT